MAAIRAAETSQLEGQGSRLAVPVVVVYGEHDIYRPSKDVLRARFPAAQHVTLKDCGHLPWLQAADAFASLLSGFYSAATPAATGGHDLEPRSRHLRTPPGAAMGEPLPSTALEIERLRATIKARHGQH